MTPSEQCDAPLPRMRKRSVAVTVLVTLNIIFSAQFLLLVPFSIFAYHSLITKGFDFAEAYGEASGLNLSALEAMRSWPVQAYVMTRAFVSFLLGILFLCAGIGLFMLKPWGRKLSLGVAIAIIVLYLVRFVVGALGFDPLMTQIHEQDFPQEEAQTIGETLGGLMLGILGLGYPLVLLICLNLRRVREQFEPALTEP